VKSAPAPAPKPATRGFARGAAIGALILTLFGGFWAFESMVHRPGALPWMYLAASLPLALLVLLAVVRFMNSGKLAPDSDPEQAARAGRKMGKSFGIIFGIEGALIGVAAGTLARAGLPLLIPVAVAVIVGLHFFPLARVFRMSVYDFTGAFCVAAGLASLFVHDATARLLALGLAMAAVLWASAAFVLLRHTGAEGQGPRETVAR
jgi:hypothetical protein